MDSVRQSELYGEAAAHAGMIERLARGYEADPDRRRDLVQEIHVEVWRSLLRFDGRCSLKTWVSRVAHNVGASHVMKSRRWRQRFVDIETLATEPEVAATPENVAWLMDRIYRLAPADRQLMLLYLEGESAGAIAEIAGWSAANVATKIHRLKKMLREEVSGE